MQAKEKKAKLVSSNPTKSNKEVVYSAAKRKEIHHNKMMNFIAMGIFMAMSVS